MAVSKMKKLSAFVSRGDLNAVIAELMELRCVEVAEVPEADFSDAHGGEARLVEKSETERKIASIREALALAHKYAKNVKSLLDPKLAADLRRFDDTPEYGEANALLASVLQKGQRLTEIKNEKAKEAAYLASLAPWTPLDVPLSVAETDKTAWLFGSFGGGVRAAQVREALSGLDAEFTALSEGATLCGAVVFYRAEADGVNAALLPLGFIRTAFPASAGTPAEEMRACRARLSALDTEREAVIEELKKDAERTALLEMLSDFEQTRRTALTALEKTGSTKYTALVCGYVPERTQDAVKRALDRYGCAYEFSEIPKGEDAPVELRNNAYARSFEWVLGMYSYPAYGTFDPTAIMSIFYFLIFGLMFADAGYGLLLVLCGFGGIRLLHPKPGMRNFLAMFGWCGFSSIVWGVLFGSYFGDFPLAFMNNMTSLAVIPDTLAVWFDPLQNPMNFLILSLAVGAVHLIAGMAVQFYTLCRDKRTLDALFDIGSWWVLFAGIALLAIASPAGKWVALAGVLLLVLTQGRAQKNPLMKLVKGVGSLYGLISYVSDLLCYSRILALGLASAVIAQVVNILATLGGPSIGGFIAMVAVFVFGHVLNLAINVLGTFVHTSRLQYIEFFGKFFVDGGRPFRPLAPTEDYTYKLKQTK